MKLKLQSNVGENLKTILNNTCTLLDLNVPKDFIEAIEHYSSFPSLDALGTALENLKVKNLCVGIDSKQLFLVPTPCILHFNTNEGHFVILNEITKDNKFKIHDPVIGWIELDIQNLNRIWTGTALIIERPKIATRREVVLEKLNYFFSSHLSLLLIPILLVLFLVFNGVLHVNIIEFTVSCLYLMGLSICLYLIKVDLEQAGGNDVCQISEEFDCKKVLDSKGAKLFNFVKLSYVGIFFFLFTFLSWNFYLLNGSINKYIQYFAIISYLSLIFVPFSIIYQWVKVKKWCVLCLSVQAVLLILGLEYFVIIGISFKNFDRIPWEMTIVAAVSVMLTFFINYYFILSFSSRKNKWKLNKFLYDVELFKRTLFSGNQINQYNLPKTVMDGDLNSEVSLIIVVDPFCDSCYKAHNQLRKIKLDVIDDFCIRTLFFTNHSKDPVNAKLIASKIMSLPEEVQSEALSAWFDSREISKWLSLYDFIDDDIDSALIDDHNNWCSMQSLQYTPIYFLNNNQVSSHYEVQDLKFHIISINREIKYQNA